MKVGLKYVVVSILILLAAGVGWYYGIRSSAGRTLESVDAVVMMERIRNVHKLVLVEGAFSEIYDYKDYWMYDLSPFRKKALVRVQAIVLAGFDLEKAEIRIDGQTHTIVIHKLPPCEILSVDHELDYYDIQEGTFNQFSEEKLTEINKGAKRFIRTQAELSGLLDKAEDRKQNFIHELSLTARAFGWKVENHTGITPQIKD